MHVVSADFGPPGAWVARCGLPVGGALLDAGGPVEPPGRYAALGLVPDDVLVWNEGDPGDPFERLEALAGAPAAVQGFKGPLPRVVCALSYDLGRVVERLPRLATDLREAPALWAARYPAVYVWDRDTGTGRLAGGSPAAVDSLAAALRASGSPPPPVALGAPVTDLSRADHAAALARIQAHIRAGDTYQINYTVRFSAPRAAGGDPTSFFFRLHRASPAPFAACLRTGEETGLFSISPERFLAWDATGVVETRPIKGTRPRGFTPAEDAEEQAALLASEKDRAEHVMIVDLERNDLGRVCRTGSVEVVKLADLETHRTVHHLVSTVRGRLRPEVGLASLLRATFPGGSITGAPKIRSMEIIEALEPVRRGPYCGAIGYLDARGGGDLNIAIRTAWATPERVVYQAGGGIVADSLPDDEWAELMVKARAFLSACEPA